MRLRPKDAEGEYVPESREERIISNSSRYQALVFLLPVPVAFVMWVKAFPLVSMASVVNSISLLFVLAAMVVSAVSFSKAMGSQYELKGSRAGILISTSGVLIYLLGTSVQSEVLHFLSVAVFYWGCVLFLGGLRSMISTVPAGLLLVSLFVPSASGVWGLAFLDGLSWVVIVASAAILLNSRHAEEPLYCGFCSSFRSEGESFCRSCGARIGRTIIAVPRRAVAGFVAFTIIMSALLTLTVPILTTTPAVTFVSYGLGGAQSSNALPPTSWAPRAQTFTVNNHQLNGYLLTSGKVSIEAYVTASTSPQVVSSNLNLARGNSSDSRVLPKSIGQEISGYNLVQKGVNYVDLQGLFQVTMLNGSQIGRSYVAVDLKQTEASFRADNGSALYGVSSAFAGWASSSLLLFPSVGGLLSFFQQFSQEAYVFSLAAVVIILFTLARDYELTKVRRLESSHALTRPEAVILEAFALGTGWMTGEQVQELAKKTDPKVRESTFFTAFDSVSKRDLVRGSILLRNKRPILLWRSLL